MCTSFMQDHTMGLITIFGLIGLMHLIEAKMHCDKVFNYYNKYGNGFDIICEDITQHYKNLLENITVSNEMTLTIQNSTLSVNANIFKNVYGIRQLRIVNSTFKFNYAEPVFKKLTLVESINIENTDLNISGYTFMGVTKLNKLALYNNKISNIEKGAFRFLKKLDELVVRKNNIQTVSDVPLCDLPFLKSLDLSENRITNPRNTRFFCEKTEKVLDFNINTSILKLGIADSAYVNTSSIVNYLEKLNLAYNNITDIGYSLDGLKRLKYLNLEGNKLKHLTNIMFGSLIDATEINLRNNLLNSISNKVFLNQKNLKFINLENNNLTLVSITNLTGLQSLNLGCNKFEANVLEHLNNLVFLETLHLCSNKITKLKLGSFSKFPRLKLLDLSGNRIQLQSETFNGLSSLAFLNISKNYLSTLPGNLFKDTTNLKNLDMSHNKLKQLTSSNIFSSLIKLEQLNLSYNLLENLEYTLFETLKNLQVLDIAGNKLHNLQYDLIFSDLPSLSVINIKYNLLSCNYLLKMIMFFKKNGITYKIHEKFEYDKENINGIYCTNDDNSPNYQASRSRSGAKSESNGFPVVAVLIVIIVIFLVSILSYKIRIYYKRRKYRPDEFELIGE